MLVAWVSSAARRIVPSPPMTSAELAALARRVVGLGRLDQAAGRGPRPGPRSAASSASSRTPMPWLGQRLDARTGDLARLVPARCGRAAGRVARSARAGLLSVTGPPSHPPPPARRRAPPPRGCRRRRWPAGPRRSHRKNSTLPDGPGSGLAVTAPAPQPRAAATVGDVGDRLGAQRRVADDPALADPVLAHLELRLHHQGQVAVGRA